MKIRNGYVSNSSSSSFLVIGKNVGYIFDEDLNLDFSNKKYALLGNYIFSEGNDYIHLDPEMYKWFKENQNNINIDDGTVIEIIKDNENSFYDNCYDDSLQIPDNIEKGTRVWNINASEHSSRTIKQLKEIYYDGE
ncbi:MAG: hypothetical protein IKP65_07600 [Alphaproteobacteria bacterium]|nr:hypothetical protein [Alphaproteobacteria bacterium]